MTDTLRVDQSRTFRFSYRDPQYTGTSGVILMLNLFYIGRRLHYTVSAVTWPQKVGTRGRFAELKRH